MDIDTIEKLYAKEFKGAKRMRVADIIELSNDTTVIVEGKMRTKKETLIRYGDSSVTSYNFELKDIDGKGNDTDILIPCTNFQSYGLNPVIALSEEGDVLTMVGDYRAADSVLYISNIVNHKFLAKKKGEEVGF
ncbi:MAG: hypothetical protein HZB68_00590 [Candidatus Aenigmarchaeota archaeon]|nr:hypothetical protein [Candidatus Aenigmarchaeota archaeon]